ncbi:MAG: ATPase [Dysgonamonadaceae bacterium]|jgi:N-acetylglucosamine kinase-like BadF-type ATPase|nr:ATPase [Dysgonamonadaceae bacterium]
MKEFYLIADSGSTKTSWRLIGSNFSEDFSTSGINPYFLGKAEIFGILEKTFRFEPDMIQGIFFYGAGCTPEKAPVLKEILADYFCVQNVEVHSDLLGAARSLCGNEAGIACILGTGSNSCFYDGKNIVRNVPALGYVLGDEGSGAVLGKKLVSDILKNQLPEPIKQKFFDKYLTNQAEIIENVYKKPFPNRFLASFAPFLSENIDRTEIKNIVETAFSEFIVRNLMQYPESKELPINFTGSVALNFKACLETVLGKFSLRAGRITGNPMEGLAKFHRHNQLI